MLPLPKSSRLDNHALFVSRHVSIDICFPGKLGFSYTHACISAVANDLSCHSFWQVTAACLVLGETGNNDDLAGLWGRFCSNVMNRCVVPAVQQKAEAVAVEERELAEQKAQLHNQQELLRQEQALVEEAAAVTEQDRKQAQNMLKVSAGVWHHPAQAPCGNHSQI